MKVLAKFEPARRYPWRQWANGKVWRIEQGKDFRCKVETMRTNIYGWALSRGLKVAVTVKGDAVEFQFVRRSAVKAGK